MAHFWPRTQHVPRPPGVRGQVRSVYTRLGEKVLALPSVMEVIFILLPTSSRRRPWEPLIPKSGTCQGRSPAISGSARAAPRLSWALARARAELWRRGAESLPPPGTAADRAATRQQRGDEDRQPGVLLRFKSRPKGDPCDRAPRTGQSSPMAGKCPRLPTRAPARPEATLGTGCGICRSGWALPLPCPPQLDFAPGEVQGWRVRPALHRQLRVRCKSSAFLPSHPGQKPQALGALESPRSSPSDQRV